MTMYISPLVDVNEIDLSTTVPAVANIIAVITLRNSWKGPELKTQLVNSIDELIETFGRPEEASSLDPQHGQSYEDILAGAGFLQFGENLYCTRVLPPSATFAGLYGTVTELNPSSSSSSTSSSSSSSTSESSSSSSSSESQSSSSSSTSGTPISGLFVSNHITDTIYNLDGFSDTVKGSIATPANNGSGVTFDGTNIISCDYFDSLLVYKHDGFSTSILDSFSTGGNPYALAWTGTNLLVLDTFAGTITMYDGFSSSIIDSITLANVAGIAWDGTNLLTVLGSTTDLIQKHDGFSLSILDSFSCPSDFPMAITWDGTNLISADNTTDLVYLHDGFSSSILDTFDWTTFTNTFHDMEWVGSPAGGGS